MVGCSGGLVAYYVDPKGKEKNIKRNFQRRYEKRRKWKLYAGGKCQRCGYDKCLDDLCFHHKDPKEKKHQVSYIFHWGGMTDEKIKKEIDKCLLVCADCHYELHTHEQDYKPV